MFKVILGRFLKIALTFGFWPTPGNAAPLDSYRIKNCLAAVYLSQLEFRRERGKYSEKFSELQLEKNPDCQGLQIRMTTATTETFVAEANNGKTAFRIDAEKRLEEIR